MSKIFQVYGLGQSLQPVLPPPLPFETAPNANQTNYSIGQIVYTPPNDATDFYIYAGGGNWVHFIGGGAGDVLSVTGANGVTASPTSGNVVVSGVNATTSTVGVASFNPTDFSVNGSGQVSLGSAGVLGVPGGGTGLSSLSTYSLMAGGTTSTGNMQQISPVTSGFVLVSKGSSALPAFSTIPAILSWREVSGSVTYTGASSGFFFIATSTMVLTGVAQGDTVSFYNNSSGTVTITLFTGQTIRNGSSTSSSGGTATSSAQGDSITLVYQLSTLTWLATSSIGTWALA